MGSYYYLMAQLPSLIYEQKPPMSSQSFKELAQSLMSEEDFNFLRYLSVVPQSAGSEYSPVEEYAASGCDFIDEWRQWERAFALNLAKYRAAKLRRDNAIAQEPPAYPHEAALTASKAVTGDASPLEAEIQIDKARWNTIDLLAGIDYFAKETVYAYYLKLLLLERRQSFNTEIGFSEYKTLYADIIESAHKSLGEPT